MKKGKKIALISVIAVVAAILIGYAVASYQIIRDYNIKFGRYDYATFPVDKAYLYEETDTASYPRTEVTVSSDGYELATFLYQTESPKAVIVVPPGLTDSNDIKIYEIQYFADAGYDVVCFDYRGCYGSTGDELGSASNALIDLDNILTYVEALPEYKDTPIYLFGHSMGAYASCAVLNYDHRVEKVVAASGFDTSRELMHCLEAIRCGRAYPLIRPVNDLLISVRYGADADISAIEGINSTDIPVLILSGSEDEYFGYGPCPLYTNSDEITNPNAEYILITDEGHTDHYGYFLTDEAVAYRASHPQGDIDRSLYMEHDDDMMNTIIEFFDEA